MSSWIPSERETGTASPLLTRTADDTRFDPVGTLGGWLTTQAAMLYWFMTPGYLAPLATMLRELMAGRLDTLLALAETLEALPFSIGAVAASPHLTPNWTRHAPDMFGAVLQRIQKHMAAAPADRHRPLGLDALLCRLHDSYSDRRESVRVGLFSSTVAEQYHPYVRPQEYGNKTDVRWAALTSAHGAGLLVLGQPLLNVSVHPYSLETLTEVRHTTDLVPDTVNWLYLDHAQCGLGLLLLLLIGGLSCRALQVTCGNPASGSLH